MRSVWVRVSVLPFTPPVQLAESKRMENAAIFALLSDGSLTGWHTLSPRADDAHKVGVVSPVLFRKSLNPM
eukprot:m.660041 g.660041  ORF g.660041 m.660041 type:complete len:71 (-) comp22728_c0_seq19:1035-1247(-)